MNGLPYDKSKGIPVTTKAGSQMQNYADQEDLTAGRHQPHGNSRNNGGRMPSLPQSIKGSIGGTGPQGQLSSHQNMGSTKRNMPLNLNSNDITFANNYTQMRKFGGANGPSSKGSS